jgi:hypothetical protein
MRDAEIMQDEGGLYVHLYKNGDLFGTVDVRNHSIHYAQEVVFNWEKGLLQENNTHIERSDHAF